jgi:MOSC domain-containing protein YiiM
MKIVSICVGGPRHVDWRGRDVETSIFKTPVAGRVHVGRLNIDGDKQSDLSVHGGIDKAVYGYPSEHYPFWHAELPGTELPWGAFGENLTTEGLLEHDVRIGDHYRIGDVELVVTQPRMPCYKLGLRFQRPDMVKRFQQAGRSGFYFAVLREGEIGAGDSIERAVRDERGLSVLDVARLYADENPERALLERAGQHPALPEGWRDYFRKRLEELDA